MNSPAAAVGNGGHDGHHSQGSQRGHAARREAVGNSMGLTKADLRALPAF